MISISPQAGHPLEFKLLPNIQIAGQIPLPEGNLARTSILPYVNSCLPQVIILVDV